MPALRRRAPLILLLTVLPALLLASCERESPTEATVTPAVDTTWSALTDPGAAVFLNELHYDDHGADTGESFEIAGTAGTDLTGWSVELENDGHGPSSAIAEGVDRLNAAAAPCRYAFLNVDARTGTVDALGNDAIKVGLIYQPARLTPVGTTAVLATPGFVTGGDGKIRNRPSLAQAFEDRNGGVFIADVNHVKSKGRACDLPAAGDGQGNCNAVWVRAAQELAARLATGPTGTDDDVPVLGDLNAYRLEDPLDALRGAGYVDLLDAAFGADAYTFAFDGAWGYLDHALASPRILAEVIGVAGWRVNADEPNALDYQPDFTSPSQESSLYAPDAVRSSDHDPVLVGLELEPELRFEVEGFFPPIRNLPEVNPARAGRAVPVKFGLGGFQGMEIFRPDAPFSVEAACDGSPLAGARRETLRTPGRSGLGYDRNEGRYQLVWKTERGGRPVPGAVGGAGGRLRAPGPLPLPVRGGASRPPRARRAPPACGPGVAAPPCRVRDLPARDPHEQGAHRP
jgi:hypothetical protein